MRPLLCVLIFSWLVLRPATADPVADAVKAGGVALVMRHATAPGVGDPEKFSVSDCSTQRNLSTERREEAQRIGLHLKSLGLVPGLVLTSQWCRCLTAVTGIFPESGEVVVVAPARVAGTAAVRIIGTIKPSAALPAAAAK